MKAPTTTAETKPGIGGILTDSVAAFLASIGASDYHLVDGPQLRLVSAMQGRIDFDCEQVCGTLSLVPDSLFIDRTHRLHPAPSPAIRKAWIGEMTNQLMGIIKGKAAQYGVGLICSLPTIEEADAFATDMGDDDEYVVELLYRHKGSSFCVKLRARLAEPTLFTGTPTDNDILVGGSGALLVF